MTNLATMNAANTPTDAVHENALTPAREVGRSECIVTSECREEVEALIKANCAYDQRLRDPSYISDPYLAFNKFGVEGVKFLFDTLDYHNDRRGKEYCSEYIHKSLTTIASFNNKFQLKALDGVQDRGIKVGDDFVDVVKNVETMMQVKALEAVKSDYTHLKNDIKDITTVYQVKALGIFAGLQLLSKDAVDCAKSIDAYSLKTLEMLKDATLDNEPIMSFMPISKICDSIKNEKDSSIAFNNMLSDLGVNADDTSLVTTTTHQEL